MNGYSLQDDNMQDVGMNSLQDEYNSQEHDA